MLQMERTKKEGASTAETEQMCNSLLKIWSVDLTFEEKQVWLWNAWVEMIKIKQRRKSSRGM